MNLFFLCLGLLHLSAGLPIEDIYGITKPKRVDLSYGEAGATSILRKDPRFDAVNAFKRAVFNSNTDRTFPWISEGIPATVHIKLPTAVEVSAFSFRSRPETIPPYTKWILQFPPQKFELVGSDDCKKWTTIFRVESTTWTTADQEKRWEVPTEMQRSFPCIGFKVLKTGRVGRAAIQDAKFWQQKPECPTNERTNAGFPLIPCPSKDAYGRYPCVDDTQLCDGRNQCPGAEDENAMDCMFLKANKKYINILQDAIYRIPDLNKPAPAPEKPDDPDYVDIGK